MSSRIVAAETPNWVAVDDRLRADRLARFDVVVHDDAQDVEAPFADHRASSVWHSLAMDCQFYRAPDPGLASHTGLSLP